MTNITQDVEALMRGNRLPPVRARKAIREVAGVGQGEFAELLGVSRFSLWRWETGKTEPQGDVRRRYAGALRALHGVSDA